MHLLKNKKQNSIKNSISMKGAVMDSISAASQELRGAPCCSKERLWSFCSPARRTPSPLPVRQVERNDEAVKCWHVFQLTSRRSETHFDLSVSSHLTGATLANPRGCRVHVGKGGERERERETATLWGESVFLKWKAPVAYFPAVAVALPPAPLMPSSTLGPSRSGLWTAGAVAGGEAAGDDNKTQ